MSFDNRFVNTAETLKYIAGSLSEVKKRIIEPCRAKLGRIARTSEGVFVNVFGNEIEQQLNSYLCRMQKVNGIWLPKSSEGNVAFAPYDSFKIGFQETGNFVQGGLARVLELTDGETARNLVVCSKKCSSVNVWGFEPIAKNRVLHKVASLSFYDTIRDRSCIADLDENNDEILFIGGNYSDTNTDSLYRGLGSMQ